MEAENCFGLFWHSDHPKYIPNTKVIQSPVRPIPIRSLVTDLDWPTHSPGSRTFQVYQDRE